MKTLMFYSYKGGSGRTVAAANVAAALAKLGRKVAILDFDFEAPGLQHVIEAALTPQVKARVGIQQYLQNAIDISELVDEIAIDVFAQTGPLSRYKSQIQAGGLLLYVMASPGVKQIDGRDPKVAGKIESLVQTLSERHGLDHIIIDAASGVGETYSLAAGVSDESLVFFRWSKQHVEGTLNFVRIMSGLKGFSQYVPFRLVASASPSDRDLEELDDQLRDELSQVKATTRAKIEKTLREYKIEPATIFHELPEMLQLKWRENLVVFGREESQYEKLATKLLHG
jgi:MinD-like ATPase involved in chromosome partitioning or flagellar assembly